MSNKNHIILASILLIFFTYFTIYNYYSSNTFFSYDEMVYDLYTINLIDHGSLCIKNDLNERFGTYLFTTPFTINSNECQYPPFSPFRIFYFALLAQIILIKYSIIIPIIFALLGGAAVFILSFFIFNNKLTALLSLIIFLSMPLVIHWATLHYFDTFGIFIFLLSTLLLFMPNRKDVNFLISGILFMVFISLRYSDILLILPLLLLILFRENNSRKKTILFLIPTMIFIISLPLVNYSLYGDSLFLPDFPKESYSATELNLMQRLFSYFSFSEENQMALLSSLNYIMNSYKIFPIIPLFIIFVALYFFRKEDVERSYKNSKGYLLLILSILIISFIFYGRGYLGYGINRISLQSSIGRYLLPFYSLTIPGISLIIVKFLKKGNNWFKNIKLISIILILIFSIVYTYNYQDYGLKQVSNQREIIEMQKEYINGTIGLNSFAVVDGVAFSILYPYIENKIYLKNHEDDTIKELIRVVDQVDGDVYLILAFYEGTQYKEDSILLLEKIEKYSNPSFLFENKEIKFYLFNDSTP